MKVLKNLKIKDIILLSIVVVALVIIVGQKIFFPSASLVDNNLKKITVGKGELLVEVVTDKKDQYNGLSFRNELVDGRGMLFVHAQAGIYKYVMRNMKFDLDFIFIKDDKVVDIAKNVSKNYKGIIKGATIYDKVLEVSAGWVDKNNVQLEDRVGGLDY